MKTWDARTGEEVLSIQGGSGFAISPDSERLAGGFFASVKLWNAKTGKELLTLPGRTNGVSSFVFSPDGQRLVSAPDRSTPDRTGMIKVWHAQTGEELLSLNGRGPVAFSPDGSRLFGRAADGTVKIWDATPLPENEQR